MRIQIEGDIATANLEREVDHPKDYWSWIMTDAEPPLPPQHTPPV